MRLRAAWEGGVAYMDHPLFAGGALHVMLLLENLIRTWCIFNGLQSRHCQ